MENTRILEESYMSVRTGNVLHEERTHETQNCCLQVFKEYLHGREILDCFIYPYEVKLGPMKRNCRAIYFTYYTEIRSRNIQCYSKIW